MVKCSAVRMWSGHRAALLVVLGWLAPGSAIAQGAFPEVIELSALDPRTGFVINGVIREEAGYPLGSAGDVNGDDIGDMRIGARHPGQTYIIFGASSGFPPVLEFSALDASRGYVLDEFSPEPREPDGTTSRPAGDIDGDGTVDEIRGHPLAGAARPLSGESTLALSGNGNPLEITVAGIDPADLSGWSVGRAGDVNADGVDDLVIGAPLADPHEVNAGATYVVLGSRSRPFPPLLDLGSLDGLNGFVVRGFVLGEESGFAAAGAGDVNADGTADLLIGAPRSRVNGDNSGRAYVVFGRKPVAVDIEPGNPVNSLNPLSRRIVTVALLGSETFDVAVIDRSTLGFGPALASPIDSGRRSLQDVNHDGAKDLVMQYRIEETGVALGDVRACLIANTDTGAVIGGCDLVTTTPPCGLGFEAALLLPLLAMWRRRRKLAAKVGPRALGQRLRRGPSDPNRSTRAARAWTVTIVFAITGGLFLPERSAGQSTAPSAVGRNLRDIVFTLASQPFGGRPTFFSVSDPPDARQGREATRAYLLARLKAISEGLDSTKTGDEAYRQPIILSGGGVNLLGMIRGSEAPEEYIILGAHYDHMGGRGGFGANGACSATAALSVGNICPGASDNAAGVAAVLAIGEGLAKRQAKPHRSVVLALWDREETGLLGSFFYTSNPLVPLESTLAYINFDVLGSEFSPSLRNYWYAIGSDTGGAVLGAMVQDAGDGGRLELRRIHSLLVPGSSGSDHLNFRAASIPSVFFTDAAGPCYHSRGDTAERVLYDKLEAQTSVIERLILRLTDSPDLSGLTFSRPHSSGLVDDREVVAEVTELLANDDPAFSSYRDTARFLASLAPDAFFSNPRNLSRLLDTVEDVLQRVMDKPCGDFAE